MTDPCRPVKLIDPMPCPGSYTLDLYCDHDNPDHTRCEFPHEIGDAVSESEARRIARSLGWKLHRDGTATCPKCVRDLKGPKP